MDKIETINWLLNELPRLQNLGVIDADNRKRLSDHYTEILSNAEVPHQRYFAFVLGVFGGLLVAAGLILFFNYNWDMLRRGEQIAVSTLPLLTAAVVSIITLTGRLSRLMRELSALLTAAGIAILLGMLSRIYNTAGQLSDFMTLLLLFVLPFIYVFNSVALGSLFVGGLFFLLDGPEGVARYFWYGLGVTPFVLYHLRPGSFCKIWMRYLAMALALFFCIVALLGYSNLPFTVFVYCNVFLLAGWEYHNRKENMLRNPWLPGAFSVLLILLGFASGSESFWTVKPASSVEGLVYYWVDVGLMLGLSVVLYFRRVWDGKRIMFALLLLLGVAGWFFQPDDMTWFSNIYLALFGVVLMFDGGRHQKLLTFNGGLLMLTVLVGCRFFDNDLGLLIRAGGFIVMGLGFIGANWFFSRRIRREA